MPGIPELACYTLVNIIPILVLALLPFRKNLRVAPGWVLLMTAALCLLNGTFNWLSRRGASAALLSVLCILLYLGFYVAAVRAGPLQLLAVLLILMNFASLASVSALFLMWRLDPELVSQPYTWGYIFCYALGLLLPFPIYYRMLDRLLSPQVSEQEEKSFWRFLWAIPAAFCAVYYYEMFSAGGAVPYAQSWKNVLFLWVVNLGFLLTVHVMIRLVEEGGENLRLQQENSQLAFQVKQYDSLKQSIEQTRRARHDLQKHLQAIQGFIDSGDMGKLADYVAQYGVSLPQNSAGSFSKNLAVDAVLRYYVEKAVQEGISLSVSFQMGEKAVIPEPDLCVLLGNLLENALEACSRAPKEKRIQVNARQVGESMLFITVDNTSFEGPRLEGGRFLSSKRKGFGTGTESVRAIAERFHGEARFSWKDQIFYASVMLNP